MGEWWGVLGAVGALVASTWCVGLLVVAAFLAPLDDGQPGALGRLARRQVPVAAWVWAGTALVALPLTLAGSLGIPLGNGADPGVLRTYAWDLGATRALLGSAVAALLVALLAGLVRSVGATAWVTVLALLGAVLPALAVPHGATLDHALPFLSAGLALLGTVTLAGPALVLGTLPVGSERDEARRRLARGAPWLAGALAYGLVLLAPARLPSASALVTTPYGVTLLLAAVAGVVLFVAAVRGAPVVRRSGPVLGGAVVLLGSVAAALTVVLPPPGDGEGPRTVAEQLVGAPLPDQPPNPLRLVAPHLDSLMLTLCVVAGALYLTGVARLRRRGIRWSVLQTVSWLLGLLSVLAVTCTGIGDYAMVLFSVHMLQHMVLTMLSPILLVLGGPVTLALRALHPAARGQRGPREWVVAALHGRPTVVLTNPIVALAIYLGSLYGLYFTGIFSWMMGSHLGHAAMLVHFLASGYLFFWTIIGTDPTPRPIPYPARILDLLVSMGVHAFFGVVVMESSALIAGGWYGRVAPSWLADPVADQVVGGGIAWAFGEIPTVITLLALMLQWSRSEDRLARRKERQAERDGDAELKAYNAYLARLAEQEQKRATQDVG